MQNCILIILALGPVLGGEVKVTVRKASDSPVTGQWMLTMQKGKAAPDKYVINFADSARLKWAHFVYEGKKDSSQPGSWQYRNDTLKMNFNGRTFTGLLTADSSRLEGSSIIDGGPANFGLYWSAQRLETTPLKKTSLIPAKRE